MNEPNAPDNATPTPSPAEESPQHHLDLGDTPGPALVEKTTIHIIDSFIDEGNKKLTAFLRKKVTLESTSINPCSFESIEQNEKSSVLLGFQIDSGDAYGIIALDFMLLHAAINLLFGGEASMSEPAMKRQGNIGIKIANKITSICVLALQNALNEHLKIGVRCTNVSSSCYAAFSQKPDQGCRLAFNMSIDAVTSECWMIIPDRILANITTASAEDPRHREDEPEQPFIGHLKGDLIDSKITVCAVLADIALLVKDVVHLRAGDIIPIEDPTFVYVTHNQKKLFTATAGQLNARRTVKIIDAM